MSDTEPRLSDFDQAVRDHDQALASRSLSIWVGAEPTFTDPASESPQWLFQALGAEKLPRALGLLRELCAREPNVLVLRTVGRQYPGEPAPRWSLGLYARRDGGAIWDGPPDPVVVRAGSKTPPIDLFWLTLEHRLLQRFGGARRFRAEAAFERRIVFRCDGAEPAPEGDTAVLLSRKSIHSQPLPTGGLVDELAVKGDYLVAIGAVPVTHAGSAQTAESFCACVELPGFSDVETFQNVVGEIGQAAKETGLTAVILQGFPPPQDATVAWTTITPDPAVVEINQAPAPDVQTFLASNRTLFSVAHGEGLYPYRMQYDGTVSDSGGGGQLTVGGPSPALSPFFAEPLLLPRLVCYLNAHPSLSYWFATDYVGSSSQSPRADEGIRDTFQELELCLKRLLRSPPSPQTLWESLSPFLADASGNCHRSELNIEKLWNPFLPGRGCLGLVEFRAFRMARTPEHAAAIAALLRAIVAMLMQAGQGLSVRDWGAELHDRFALPHYLERDLVAVLTDLDQAGLGLGEPIVSLLRDPSHRCIGSLEWGGCVLGVDRALEFWPLVGDVASQEGGGSRTVDASTRRIQILLRPRANVAWNPGDWQLGVGGYRLPLRLDQDDEGVLLLAGLRYRSFKPWRGLHPQIDAQGPIELVLSRTNGADAVAITLHDWRPDGAPYQGLPDSLSDAAQRRAERLVVRPLGGVAPSLIRPPEAAQSPYCLDLRKI